MVTSKKIALAYSGGLDSRFLALTLKSQGADLLLLNAVGPHIAPIDTEYALEWARKNDLPCLQFPFDPLVLPGIDTKERCYVCKKKLFQTMKAVLSEKKESDRVLCDGTNSDDRQGFRPGIRALREEDILSPLDEGGLGKAEIRSLARVRGLENPEQKPRPCLLTRLAYGMRADEATLARLAEAEAAIGKALTEFLEMPPPDLRLRLTPTPLLQIEDVPRAFLPKLRNILDESGFLHCRLQFGGGISGFFDRKEMSDEDNAGL